MTFSRPLCSGRWQRKRTRVNIIVFFAAVFCPYFPLKTSRKTVKMSNNTAPDNWESQADSNSANNSPDQNADVTAKFSTLNVNAVEFVPSFSFGPQKGSENESSPKEGASKEASPQHQPVLNGKWLSNCIFWLLSEHLGYMPSIFCQLALL